MTSVSTTQLTPLSFLERSSRVWADKPAIVHGETRVTYAEFGASAMRLARALRASGVRSGDRVAYLMPNVPEMLVAHFGVPLAGGVLVAVNTRLLADEVRYILQHSASRVLVVDSAYSDVALKASAGADELNAVVVVGDAEGADDRGWLPYEQFMTRQTGDVLAWEVADELAPISISYTSGTTGRPKGVVYTHRGAYLNALGEIVHSRHTPESVYLWTLPMFHCNGWCTPWAVTGIGGTHVCLRDVRGDVIWSLIRTHQVTHLNAAPAVITAIMNATDARPLSSPLRVTTAGAPPSPTTIAQMEDMGFSIVHVYGLTETYGPHSVCEVQPSWAGLPSEQRAGLQARQGVAMVQAEPLRVVDKGMQDVPADGQTIGEIVMRGNNVMAGYYQDPEGTEHAFRGGWFHSGDLGVMHPDGYVELRDRAKDVVVSGGENISTIEVEQALMSHPGVLEVAVVGVPDDRWGERPKAFVVLRRGHEATGQELIQHVRNKIAHYKAPRDVDIVAELPKTSTDKIQKFRLREVEWAGHTSRIHG